MKEERNNNKDKKEELRVLTQEISRMNNLYHMYRIRGLGELDKDNLDGFNSFIDEMMKIKPFLKEAYLKRINIKKSIGDIKGSKEDLDKLKKLNDDRVGEIKKIH